MIDTGMLTKKAGGKPLTNGDTPNKFSEEPTPKFYHDLFLSMNEGYAICKVMFDSHGDPIDWFFIEANKACKRLLGFQNKRVTGRKITELSPSLKVRSFDWVRSCGSVAITGRNIAFSQPWLATSKWLSVNVLLPGKRLFCHGNSRRHRTKKG